MEFKKVFGEKKAVIGMVHLKALPGSPHYGGNMEEIYRAAVEDLHALEKGGVNAAIVENFGDVPYTTENEFITQMAMAVLCARLRRESGLVMGLNVQFNDTAAEWAIAHCAEYDFIRVEALAENRIGPNGLVMVSGPSLLRTKAKYPADAMIFADIQVKHTYPLVDQPMEASIDAAKEADAAAIIITGAATGCNPTLADVKEAKELGGGMPVLLGSGIKAENAAEFFQIADGAIVGSSFKKDGNVWNGIDETRVRRFMETLGQ